MGITNYPAHTVRRPDLRGLSALDYGVSKTASALQNADALQAAINAASLNGLQFVDIPSGVYQCNADVLRFASGVYVRGVIPRQAYIYNQPDLGWSMAGGTIFEGPGSGTFMQYQGSGGAAADWSARSIGNAGILGCGIRGFAKGLSTGGTTIQGMHFSTYQDLYFTDITDTAVEYINGQHLTMDRVQGYIAGNGLRFQDDLNLGTYGSGGNSRLNDVMWLLTGYDAFGFSLESKTVGASSALNEISASRLQVNAFSNRSVASQTQIATIGTGTISVSDTTKFPPGMPVMFDSTSGTSTGALMANKCYFILTRNVNSGAGTLTVSDRFNGNVITPNGAGTPNIISKGQALFRILGYSPTTSDSASNINLNEIDIEGRTGCGLLLQDVSRSKLSISECGGPNSADVNVSICMRNSKFSEIRSGGSKIRIDSDSISAGPDGTLFYGSKSQPLVGGFAAEPDQTLAGIYYDVANNMSNWMMSRFSGLRSSGNNYFIRPTKGLGQFVYARGSTITLTGNESGLINCIVANSSQTYTLPILVGNAANFATVNVGIPFWFVNPTAFAITLATQSSQTFQNIAGKTTLSVPAYSSAMLMGLSDTGSASLASTAVYWGVLSVVREKDINGALTTVATGNTLTDAQFGHISLSNASAATLTLQTATAANLTEELFLMNCGAGTWTVSLGGAQKFNNIALKTSLALLTGDSAHIAMAWDGTTYFPSIVGICRSLLLP